MSVSKSSSTQKSAAQQLEEQRGRFQALAARRNKVEVVVSTAQAQLAEAQAEAEKEFGTGDLVKLRELYAKQDQENERVVTEFAHELDSLEIALADTEAQLA